MMMMMEFNDLNYQDIESFRLQQMCPVPQPEIPQLPTQQHHQYHQQSSSYPSLNQLEELLELKPDFSSDQPSWSSNPTECTSTSTNNTQSFDDFDQGVPLSPCLDDDNSFESFFTFPDPPFTKQYETPTLSSTPTASTTTLSPTLVNPTDFASRGPVISMGPEGLKLVKGYESDYSSDSDYASMDSPSSPPAPCYNTESVQLNNHSSDNSSCSSRKAINHNTSCVTPKSASPSSASAGKRRANHRLAPLPKFWSEDLLQMPTKQLNMYLKEKNFTPQEIAALKTCRRRIKNRGYTRNSRQRKSNESGLESPH